ncbi:unnamed protein product [Closterium sp. NIES-54]
MGLVLGGRGLVVLTGQADASWVDDLATQWSSQGYTFSLGSGSVSCRSTRSSSVLNSSCEAEIYAGAMAAQELRWLTYLLTDLREQPRSSPVLYVDNKAMIALCLEHRLEHRTKHIALRYFLARELQQRGQLRLAYVATRANTADIFTKALPPGKIWVPNYALLRQVLLEEFHNVAYAGHFGSNKTLAGIAKYYYWPRMAVDVQQFVTSCDTCQRMKSSKQKKTGLLQPLPVPEQPWQVVSLDFITGLPSTSRGHDAILVVIDKFSKMGHFIPTNATATAEETARLFFDRIITIYGIPATLILDRDPKFTTKHDFVTTMQQLWEKTQRRLSTMQNSHKQYADRQRRDHSVAVGDQVLLDTRNLELSHLPSKLRPRFCGPFRVESHVTPVTFRLRLPTTWKLHNAFHVQLMKPYQDPNQQLQGRQLPPPPPVLVQDEPEYEVERVLAHRRRRSNMLEFLIRWKGYDLSEDIWVAEADMGNAYRALKDYLVKQGVSHATQL